MIYDSLCDPPANETIPHLKYLFDYGDKDKYIVYEKLISISLNESGTGDKSFPIFKMA